ncbi:MAG: hypothetical protein WAN23_17875 [Candidatus Acidiferrales bacterium]
MANAGRENVATFLLLTKLAIFTVLVPGTVTVWLPLFLLYPGIRHRPMAGMGTAIAGAIVIAIGVAGYRCALISSQFSRSFSAGRSITGSCGGLARRG